MTSGGRRPGSGRHCRDSVRVWASVLRPIYLELVRQEKLTGVYRCQIVGRIITEHLVGGIVDNELRDVVQARPARQARNGSEPLPEKMRRSFASFHW
jgi:hypothetical protein